MGDDGACAVRWGSRAQQASRCAHTRPMGVSHTQHVLVIDWRTGTRPAAPPTSAAAPARGRRRSRQQQQAVLTVRQQRALAPAPAAAPPTAQASARRSVARQPWRRQQPAPWMPASSAREPAEPQRCIPPTTHARGASVWRCRRLARCGCNATRCRARPISQSGGLLMLLPPQPSHRRA